MTATVTRPRYLHVPDGALGNYADEVADVAALLGRPLDESQRLVVEARTSYGKGGAWLALETLTKMGRQSGKTGGIETPICFTDLFLWNADRIAWTAHLFKTSREAFEDHVRLIQSAREFESRVQKIQYANGEEAILLKSGARMDYLARSKGGGRGLGGKRVVIDEALFFTGEQAGAILPILAARQNTQIDYLSSAAKRESVYLRRLTKRGRDGGDPSLILAEFAARGGWDDPGCSSGAQCLHVVGTPGCSLDNVELYAEANPAVASGRVSLEFLRSMRLSLPPLEFGREFLGWDEPGDDMLGQAIPPANWAACTDETSQFVGRPVLAVAASRDGASASIAAAGMREDGVPHVELIEHRRGTDWVVERCAELKKHRPVAWVVDKKTHAATLLPELKAAGIRPREMNTNECGQACAGLQNAVRDRQLRHLGDEVLTAAVAGAARRDIGDGLWAWSAKTSEVDIVTLVAVTNALWGLQVTPKPRPLVSFR